MDLLVSELLVSVNGVSKSLAILHSSVPSVSRYTQQFNKYLLSK